MRGVVAILIVLALLALEAVIVWRPFVSAPIGWQSSGDDKRIAGEMVGSFHLSQEIPARLLSAPRPSRHITHWWRSHRKLYSQPPNCFAIRFADYGRINSGRITIAYAQGQASQSWRVEGSSLRSDFRRFCPDNGLRSDQPLHITINATGGKSGDAASVWLSRSGKLKPAVVNGHSVGKRSLLLRLVHFRRIGPVEIFGIDHGAYAFACFMSLMIGLLAALSVKPKRQPRRSKKPDKKSFA